MDIIHGYPPRRDGPPSSKRDACRSINNRGAFQIGNTI